MRAVPLDKLCEYEGGELPKKHDSDCYLDVDESPFACAEKQRILVRGWTTKCDWILKESSFCLTIG